LEALILAPTEKDLVQLLSVDDLVARFACVADRRLDLGSTELAVSVLVWDRMTCMCELSNSYL